MNPKTYISSFRTGPDATKKQQMLFATDTAYALSEGYELIQDSKGIVFRIIDEYNIVELDDTEDLLQAEPTQVNFNAEELIENGIFISNHTLTGDKLEDGSFFDDVAYAFSVGLGTIEDARGYGYTINSATSVTSLYGLTDSEDPEVTPFSTPAAIDKIINNTLNQSVPLRTDQVDSLIKLAKLKILLQVD